MTTTTVTIQQVRDETGIDTTLVDDTQVQAIIDRVCGYTDEYFQIKTTPILNIDYIEVVDEFAIDTMKNPLLSLKQIKQNNSIMELSDFNFTSPGSVRSDFRRFFNNQIGLRRNNIVYLEYYYGWMEAGDVKETTTSDLEVGTSVNIVVTDSSLYTINDWVRLKGFDGNLEISKVTALPNATTITVEQLVFPHESSSLIEKLVKPAIIDQYILKEASLGVARNSIGSTYTFNTSYSIEGVQATKGVPYPHFEKVYNTLLKERDDLKTRIHDSLIRVL